MQEARLMRANDFVSIYKILKDPFVNQDDDDEDCDEVLLHYASIYHSVNDVAV